MSYKFESIFLKTLGELGVEFKAKQRVKSIKTNLWGPSCLSWLVLLTVEKETKAISKISG